MMADKYIDSVNKEQDCRMKNRKKCIDDWV